MKKLKVFPWDSIVRVDIEDKFFIGDTEVAYDHEERVYVEVA